LWSKKRYSDPNSGETPCNPMLAKTETKRKETDYTPQQMWQPFKDSDDIDF